MERHRRAADGLLDAGEQGLGTTYRALGPLDGGTTVGLPGAGTGPVEVVRLDTRGHTGEAELEHHLVGRGDGRPGAIDGGPGA